MKRLSLLIIALTLFTTSCIGEEEKSELILFEKTEADYNQFINQKALPANPNLTIDKRIVNDDYPIEIALYNDGQFYYNLETLADGKGSGTYSYENGVLKLSSVRKFFGVEVDMDYTFTITKKDGTTSLLKFRDRFGNKAYKTTLAK